MKIAMATRKKGDGRGHERYIFRWEVPWPQRKEKEGLVWAPFFSILVWGDFLFSLEEALVSD